jgi:predicted nucleic acid-binding protein
MTATRTFFADTSYLIALINPVDEAHQRTVAYASQPVFIVTTQWVFAEFLAYLSFPRARGVAAAFLEQLARNRRYTVVPACDPDFQAGLTLYRERPDKAWSLIDCISFEVMRQHGLREALSTDVHFEQAGYHALLRN